jgi:hypothetical protein
VSKTAKKGHEERDRENNIANVLRPYQFSLAMFCSLVALIG